MITDITRFADRFNLKTKREECREPYVPCRRGQIYAHGDGRLAVLVIGPGTSPRTWSGIRRRLLAAGFTLHQDGDAEGSLLFDPNDTEQCREAIRAMGAHRQRRYSPEDQERLARHLAGFGRNQSTPRENMAFTA